MFEDLKDFKEILEDIKFLQRLFSDIDDEEETEKEICEEEIFKRLDKLFLKLDYNFYEKEKEKVLKAIKTILSETDFFSLYSISVLFLFFLYRPDLAYKLCRYIEKEFEKEGEND